MLSDTPYFSIGVTTFKRRELLVETLTSILAQTFLDFEVIVGNDNADELLTQEMLGIGDPRVRILNHPVNLGEIANMNELLAQSRGRFFTWLADDDLYTPDFLQAVRDAHERFGPVSCVFTGYASGACSRLDRVEYAATIRRISGRDFLGDYLNSKIQAVGCYGVFETHYLRESGGMVRLGNGFSPYSDNLLAIKAGLLGYLCYVDAPLIFFRTHPGSISFTSPDFDAYASAQSDLCSSAIKIFRAEQLRDDLRQNLYRLLSHWCLTFAFHVLERSGNYRLSGFIWSYLRSIFRYSADLGVGRIRLMGLAALLLFKHQTTPFRKWVRGIRSGMNSR